MSKLQGFYDFINQQSSDKRICNDSWRSCAVGEYVRNTLGLTESEYMENYYDGHSYLDDEFLDALREENYSLYDKLSGGEFSSYGQLKEYINIDTQ